MHSGDDDDDDPPPASHRPTFLGIPRRDTLSLRLHRHRKHLRELQLGGLIHPQLDGDSSPSGGRLRLCHREWHPHPGARSPQGLYLQDETLRKDLLSGGETYDLVARQCLVPIKGLPSLPSQKHMEVELNNGSLRNIELKSRFSIHLGTPCEHMKAATKGAEYVHWTLHEVGFFPASG